VGGERVLVAGERGVGSACGIKIDAELGEGFLLDLALGFENLQTGLQAGRAGGGLGEFGVGFGQE